MDVDLLHRYHMIRATLHQSNGSDDLHNSHTQGVQTITDLLNVMNCVNRVCTSVSSLVVWVRYNICHAQCVCTTTDLQLWYECTGKCATDRLSVAHKSESNSMQ